MGFQPTSRASQHATTRYSINANGASKPLSTTSKVEYESGYEQKPTHDSEGNIDGFTIGEQTTDGNLAMSLGEWKLINQWLRQQIPNTPLRKMKLKLVVQYEDEAAQVIGRDIVDFMFKKDSFKSENNQERHIADMPIFVAKVTWQDGE